MESRSSDRSKADHEPHLEKLLIPLRSQLHLGVHPGPVVHHDPEGHGAHRVSNIGELLLSSELKHIVEHAWEIVLAHLVKGEPPELFSGWVEDSVLPAVCISPEVSHPHIIPSVGKNEAFVGTCVLMFIMITLTHAYPVLCPLLPAPSQQMSRSSHAEGRPRGRHPPPPWVDDYTACFR